jgi:RNA polymerase sigma factor (sigma-70 family)
MGQTIASLHFDAMAPEQGFDIAETYANRRHELIRFLVSLGVSSCDAEDIAQEAFLRAFSPSPGAEQPRNLFRWLLACAKNLAINHYRRNGRETTISGDSWKRWENALSDSSGDVEQRLHDNERRIRVTQALDALPAAEQQCLLLRSQGAPFREIAAELDVSLRRAVYLTSVAIKKVQSRLNSSN